MTLKDLGKLILKDGSEYQGPPNNHASVVKKRENSSNGLHAREAVRKRKKCTPEKLRDDSETSEFNGEDQEEYGGYIPHFSQISKPKHIRGGGFCTKKASRHLDYRTFPRHQPSYREHYEVYDPDVIAHHSHAEENNPPKDSSEKYFDYLSARGEYDEDLEYTGRPFKPPSYRKIMKKIKRQRYLSSVILNSLKRPLSKSLTRTFKKYYEKSKRAPKAFTPLSDLGNSAESFTSDASYRESETSEATSSSDTFYNEKNVEHSSHPKNDPRNPSDQQVLSVSPKIQTQNPAEPQSENKFPSPKTPSKHKNSTRNRIPPKFWTTEENNQLLSAVQKYGNQWGRVANAVKNRSSRQCKEHWTRVLSKREEAVGINARVIAKHSKARETEKLLKQWRDYQKLFTENCEDKTTAVTGSLDIIKGTNLPSSNVLPNDGSIGPHDEIDRYSNSDYNFSASEKELSNDNFQNGSNSPDEHLESKSSSYTDPKDADPDIPSLGRAEEVDDDPEEMHPCDTSRCYQTGKAGQDIIKIGYWLPEEDQALVAAHARLGSRWIQVANIIPGRTKRQCERRFRRLREKLRKQMVDPDEIDNSVCCD